MKILELTNYSAGVCGVWQRVKQESLELSQLGYDINIFSSNLTKGSDEIAKQEDSLGEIKIKRFSCKKFGGESFMKWNFEKEAIKLAPEIIICHSYRHIHTIKALNVAKELKKQGKACKVFLVTHAPFIENNKTRSLLASLIVTFYDYFFARTYINKFNKIIAITHWEYPLLKKIGCRDDKIVYIPNGIPKEFFNKKIKSGKGIFFLGRISPVKNLETLIAAKNIPLKISLIGPKEIDYFNKLKELIIKEGAKNIEFLEPVYDLKKKISLIDKFEIFVLPSKTEAMPQALIEAMARGKIVISSKTPGGREIVSDRENGFLFEIGGSTELSKIVNDTIKMPVKEKNKIINNAIKTSKKFKWGLIVKEIEKLF